MNLLSEDAHPFDDTRARTENSWIFHVNDVPRQDGGDPAKLFGYVDGIPRAEREEHEVRAKTLQTLSGEKKAKGGSTLKRRPSRKN